MRESVMRCRSESTLIPVARLLCRLCPGSRCCGLRLDPLPDSIESLVQPIDVVTNAGHFPQDLPNILAVGSGGGRPGWR